LGWDDARWQAEEEAYRALWQRCYSLPDAAAIADWRPQLAAIHSQRQQELAVRQQRQRRQAKLIGLASGLSAIGLLWAVRLKMKTRKRHVG